MKPVKKPSFLAKLAGILGKTGFVGMVVFYLLDMPWLITFCTAILIAGFFIQIESELS